MEYVVALLIGMFIGAIGALLWFAHGIAVASEDKWREFIEIVTRVRNHRTADCKEE